MWNVKKLRVSNPNGTLPRLAMVRSSRPAQLNLVGARKLVVRNRSGKARHLAGATRTGATPCNPVFLEMLVSNNTASRSEAG